MPVVMKTGGSVRMCSRCRKPGHIANQCCKRKPDLGYESDKKNGKEYESVLNAVKQAISPVTSRNMVIKVGRRTTRRL